MLLLPPLAEEGGGVGPVALEAAGADAVALLAGVVGVAPDAPADDDEGTPPAGAAVVAEAEAPAAERTSLGAGSFHAGLAGGGAGSRCGACEGFF